MDFHIRYWNNKAERVNVHYLNSSIMGKSSANDVFQHFDSFIETIYKTKLLQVFSDGPNMNLEYEYS